MSTGLTYATLVEDMKRYTERGFTGDTKVIDEIPRLVNRAERRLGRELKVQGTIEPLTSTMVDGQSTYAKPDRWRETVSFFYGAGQQRQALYTRSYEVLRTFWPDPTVKGLPRFYADYDYNNWLVAPTPNANFNFEVLCYMLPPLLGDTNGQNWLTEYAPELLQAACFWELSLFIKNYGAAKTWEDTYNRTLQVYQGEDMKKILDRATKRDEA